VQHSLAQEGSFHRPDSEATAGAVLLFHGNTMNFYVGAPRFLPPVLTRLGFACLAFNRRGHDILSKRDGRAAEGAASQRRSAGSCDVEIVPSCDRFYVRREAAICDLSPAGSRER
jgi:hypothetical protein